MNESKLIASARNALDKCRARFSEYAQHHADKLKEAQAVPAPYEKGVDELKAKIERNIEMELIAGRGIQDLIALEENVASMEEALLIAPADDKARALLREDFDALIDCAFSSESPDPDEINALGYRIGKALGFDLKACGHAVTCTKECEKEPELCNPEEEPLTECQEGGISFTCHDQKCPIKGKGRNVACPLPLPSEEAERG